MANATFGGKAGANIASVPEAVIVSGPLTILLLYPDNTRSLLLLGGLQRWEEERERWLSSVQVSNLEDPLGLQRSFRSAINIDVDEVIDLIFSNRWRTQTPKTSSSGVSGDRQTTKKHDDSSFPEPVPLPQMIDILIDLWEAEGLEM